MRAVNLIPGEAGSGSTGGSSAFQIPAYAVLAVLAAALVLVTVYVLSSNSIADRQAKIGALQAQAAQEGARAASLSKYVQFQQLAQTRAETVRQIAASRFDWHSALSDLSKVIPANASLQSLYATVAPGSGAGVGGAGAGTAVLRAAVAAPAFELTGCAATQPDVAVLISRLRVINGVTRVTLADSTKPTNASAGATQPTTAAASTGSPTGCGPNSPVFDIAIFFKPLPGAISTSTTTPAAGAATTPAPATATATTTSTTPGTTPTTTTPSTGAGK